MPPAIAQAVPTTALPRPQAVTATALPCLLPRPRRRTGICRLRRMPQSHQLLNDSGHCIAVPSRADALACWLSDALPRHWHMPAQSSAACHCASRPCHRIAVTANPATALPCLLPRPRRCTATHCRRTGMPAQSSAACHCTSRPCHRIAEATSPHWHAGSATHASALPTHCRAYCRGRADALAYAGSATHCRRTGMPAQSSAACHCTSRPCHRIAEATSPHWHAGSATHASALPTHWHAGSVECCQRRSTHCR